jgi:hypothetical protein
LLSYSRAWCPQKTRSMPPARTTRTLARAPQRSQWPLRTSSSSRVAMGVNVGVTALPLVGSYTGVLGSRALPYIRRKHDSGCSRCGVGHPRIARRVDFGLSSRQCARGTWPNGTRRAGKVRGPSADPRQPGQIGSLPVRPCARSGHDSVEIVPQHLRAAGVAQL